MSARIIVLDQDQTLHAQYCALLEGEGFAVKCYASLPDPRTILLQRPSLILLDYFVGTTSYGWIWLITLRTYAEEDIPVLVCTADNLSLQSYAQDLDDLEAKLLPKPFTPHDLVQAVHQHATKTHSVSPAC
jgi:CheY-like chemotaxis protein